MRSVAFLRVYTVEREYGAAEVLRAVLPPLALFAALSLVFASILNVPLHAPALLMGVAVLALAALMPPKWSRVLLLATLAIPLGAVVLSSTRGGAAALANRLYDASEAVNAYAYERFESAGEARAALPWLALLGGALCAFAARRRIGAVALFLGVAFLEGYFGVTPPAWQNLLLFAALALPLVSGGREAGSAAALLAGAAAVTLAVCLLVPRPIAAVEAYSEHLRDELGAAAMALTQSAPPESETNRVRQESRQHAEAAYEDGTGTAREFERRTENERELSLPHRVDWLRIALLLLAVVALLIVPFLPFLLFSRAQRRAEERRAAFAAADNAAAIRAMFAHTMDWLRAGGLQTENRPFAACKEAVEKLTSASFAAQYAEAASIWQEAAYSRHAMTDAQRKSVRALLDAAAETLYEKADRRTRFRMKYIDCLCGS